MEAVISHLKHHFRLVSPLCFRRSYSGLPLTISFCEDKNFVNQILASRINVTGAKMPRVSFPILIRNLESCKNYGVISGYLGAP